MVLDPEWQLKQEGSLSLVGELKEEKLYQLKFKWVGLKV
jgi:hypothetical protein